MAVPTKLTKLQAVNRMLSAIGVAPVNSITAPVNSQVAHALGVLDESLSDVLLEGFAFNNEKNVLFTPVSSLIAQPADVIDAVSETVNLVWVDGYAYNRDLHTNLWSGPIYLNVVYFRDFDYIPEAARAYITARAARMFYERLTDQSGNIAGLQFNEARARMRLLEQEADNTSANILTGSQGVFRTVNREAPLDSF